MFSVLLHSAQPVLWGLPGRRDGPGRIDDAYEQAFRDLSSEDSTSDTDAPASLGTGGTVLFEDAYSDVAELAHSQESLEDAYLVLHPEAREAPAQLHDLTEALRLQRARAMLASPAGAFAFEPSDLVLDKDLAGFYSNACQPSSGGFSGYEPNFCTYKANVNRVCTSSTVATRDKSVGWNETPYAATHSLSASTWKPVIPAWNWYWTEWGGAYSKAYACLSLASGQTGNLGITHHRYWTDQHLVPVNE